MTKEQEIAYLESLVAKPTPAQERAAREFLGLMQADAAEFDREARKHRIVCKRGRLWWFGYRVLDWVLRRFGI